ncbi:MAG: hypothetical protein AAF591_12025 [Verrucomicrobiota bacterium]
MIDRIEHDGMTLAIIIRSTYHADGIEFFTPDDYSQQLAYMNRPKGHRIKPHVHNRVERSVALTQEVLFIRSGIVRVDFYDNSRTYVTDTILERGDVILLAAGGHGFTMLEPTEMIEVKQGPYAGDQDKTLFQGKYDEPEG